MSRAARLNGMFHVEHWFRWPVRLEGWITVSRETTLSFARVSPHRGRCFTWNNASGTLPRSGQFSANGCLLFGYHAEYALSETRIG